ncbi:MAG: DUF1634 domain-containing protein [Acidobacteriia bacterium]|nr:DUF1634 domain-containing protein [Terriglobia bacterium]
MERALGRLLRAGVLAALALVLPGACLYLAGHGWERPDYHTFRGEPAELRRIASVLRQAMSLHGQGLIQLGVLLLIATPVARVASSAYAFARQGDRLYVAITLAVLGVLAYSLLGSR